MRSITVPLDGSGFAEAALPPALSLAAHSGAALHLVHVQVPPPTRRAEAMDGWNAWVTGYLADLEARVHGAESGLEVDVRVLSGRVAPALVSHLEASRSDLVVLSSHGRGPLSRLWLGSVADEVVRSSPVPVVVVRPGDEGPPDLLSEPVFRRVLVPLDGSACAEEALAPALEVAEVVEGEMTLFRVVPYPPALGIPMDEAVLPRSWAREEKDEAVDYLAGVAARLKVREVPLRWEGRVEANVAQAILDYAAQGSFDLVAMSTHGLGGMRRFVLGSVTDKVLRGAELPVLVTRPL